MARARNIKPGFFTNDELVELPFEARLLFIGLWTIADKEGRLNDRPKKIKMEIFPADDVNCDAALSMLAKRGFLRRYAVDGSSYIQIVNWDKHQNPHIKEAPSLIPPEPEQAPEIPVQASEQPERAGLIPDSLLSDSGFRIVGNAPEPVAPAAPKKSRAPAKTPLPADFCISERVQRWADEKGHRNLQRHFDHFVSACKAKGYVYADWDQALQNAIRDDWAKLSLPQARGSPGGYESAKDRSRREAAEQLTGRKRYEQPDFIDIN